MTNVGHPGTPTVTEKDRISLCTQWGKPSGEGRASIVCYDIGQCVSGAESWSLIQRSVESWMDEETQTHVRRLQENTVYEVRVRATSGMS